MYLKYFAALFLLPLLIAANLVSPPPVLAVDEEDYTYKLSQSTGGHEFWTTLPSERVFKDNEVPADTGSRPRN